MMGLFTVGILKYLSSVVKSFTSSASLVMTSILSSILFDVKLKYPFYSSNCGYFFISTLAFYLAVLNLSIAIYLYRSFPEPPTIQDIPLTPMKETPFRIIHLFLYIELYQNLLKYQKMTLLLVFVLINKNPILRKINKCAKLNEETLCLRNILFIKRYSKLIICYWTLYLLMTTMILFLT